MNQSALDNLLRIGQLKIEFNARLVVSREVSMPKHVHVSEPDIDPTITCAACKACCCHLEVILMGDDDPPPAYVETDAWGGQVMTRLDDGWCAALDRGTMRCRIYERRPGVCRDFEMGSSECIVERAALNKVIVLHPR